MKMMMKAQASTRTLRSVGALVLGGALAVMVMSPTASADTLHGYCFAGPACTDNGTNTPTGTNPPEFGFHGSGVTDSGDTWYVLLLPTSPSDPTSIGLKGTVNSTATLFSTTPWTSGGLDTYLHISASPNNPIGAFGAGGSSYEVYVDDLGTQTITGTSGPQETTTIGLPIDSYIVAFINTGNATAPDWSATANSGAILEQDAPPPPTVPEPSSLLLLCTGLVGAAVSVKRFSR